MFDSLMQETRDQEQRDQAQRQVDVEDPAPADLLGEKAADGRSEQARNTPDGAEQTGDAGALLEWIQVAQDSLVHRQQPTRAEPLDQSKGDQLLHGLGLP